MRNNLLKFAPKRCPIASHRAIPSGPVVFCSSLYNFINGKRAQIIFHPISYSASFDYVHRKLISIIVEDYSNMREATELKKNNWLAARSNCECTIKIIAVESFAEFSDIEYNYPLVVSRLSQSSVLRFPPAISD